MSRASSAARPLCATATVAPSALRSAPSVSAASRLSSTTRIRRRGKLAPSTPLSSGGRASACQDRQRRRRTRCRRRARRCALRRVPPCMRDQAAHQRQADAEPALCAAVRAIDLREHVEHRRELVGRDADAVVADGDDGAAVAPSAAAPDVAAGVGVLGGVVEQVGRTPA